VDFLWVKEGVFVLNGLSSGFGKTFGDARNLVFGGVNA